MEKYTTQKAPDIHDEIENLMLQKGIKGLN
jgi:hypothetical protein